tara:strand:- start:148 stop:285 length:138 start_codon:yes stop_codon:yes gene_type:complete
MVKNNKRKKAGVPKKKHKSSGPVKAEIARGCGKVMGDRRKVTKHF